MIAFLLKTDHTFPNGETPSDWLDGFHDWTLLELRRELTERGLTPWDSREALALRLAQDDEPNST